MRWYRPMVVGLAFGGALVTAGLFIQRAMLGGWPTHDAAAYWLAGRHLLEGQPVYGAETSYLAFLYAPPLAVVAAPLSLLPLDAVALLILVAEILALRYVAGSWTVAGLLCLVPFTYRELATGNVNLIIAALILASVRGLPTGWGIALASFAKFSPAGLLVIGSRRQWRDALVAGAVLMAVTLPWWHLWPEWIGALQRAGTLQAHEQAVPLLPRLALVVPLLLLRRRWSVAAAVGLGVPTFHVHSAVLLYPAARLLATRRSHEPARRDPLAVAHLLLREASRRGPRARPG